MKKKSLSIFWCVYLIFFGTLVISYAATQFQVAPVDDWVTSSGPWTPEATISLTIEDGSGVVYSDSQTADASGNFNFGLGGVFDLQRGHVVTVSDGADTKTHTVTNLFLDSIDVAADTVSGRADADTSVNVWVHEHGSLTVTADASGNWTADFSGMTDLTYLSNIGSNQTDSDGDTTEVHWSPPQFRVQPDHDWVMGESWTPGATISLTIEDGSGVVYSDSQTADASGNFNFGLGGVFDLQRGHVVTVSDGVDTKTHTVTNLFLDSIDVAADTVSGRADADTSVNVWVHEHGSLTVTADASGNWTADFSGMTDLTYLSNIGSNQTDSDGDTTEVHWSPPQFRVQPDHDWVMGESWTPGATISLTIEDGGGVVYSDSQTADASGNFNFGLGGVFDLQRGHVVTVSDGVDTKTHTVTNLFLDSIDVAADTVSGRADADTSVNVWVHEHGSLTVTADASGNWTADFSGMTDLTYLSNIGSNQTDSDGDTTEVHWSPPQFRVQPDHDWVMGESWTPGATISLTIEDGGGVVYSDSQTADASGNFNFGLGGVFDLQRGHVVTVSDGVDTKTHTVTNLFLDSVDVAADTVSGRADADTSVDVWVHEHGSLTVTADASGNWTADFSGMTDLTYLSNIGSNQTDSDGDTTEVHWSPPQFRVQPDHDWVMGESWTPGATISLTIEDGGGVVYSDSQTADAAGNFSFELWGGVFDLQRGHVVTVSDGVDTKTHTVTNLFLDSVDVAADTVSGRANADTSVDVWVHEHGSLTVTADASGNWTADFSGMTDLTYLSNIGSNQTDSDGDTTEVHWDPFNDNDGDGLSNDDEINVYGTDPDNPDSDGDWINDGDEVNTYNTDPNDSNDFTPPGTGAIRGTIKDAGENPITGISIEVQVYTGDPCGQNQHITGVWSNATIGTYAVVDLDTNQQYFLRTVNWQEPNYVNEWWASPSSSIYCHDAQAIDVFADAWVNNTDFQLDLGGSISGTVTDGTTGIANVCIDVYAGTCHSGHYYGVQTDPDGNFEIGGLPPGQNVYIQANATCTGLNYIIQWYGGDYTCESAQPALVGATDVDFSLQAGGSISGYARDTSNNYITNLHIYAWDYDTGEGLAGSNTDGNGKYTLLGLPSGDYRLRTCSDCNNLKFADEYYDNVYHWDSATRVPVTAPDDTLVNDFILEVGNTISGTITGLSPNQNIHIGVTNDRGTPHDGSDDLEFWTNINGNGSGTDSYSIQVFPADGYRVEFSPENAVRVYYKSGDADGTWIWDDATPVDASTNIGGIDIAVTSGNTISGTITGLASGQHIHINVFSDNGTPNDGSDDLWFGDGFRGSGIGTDPYTIHVAPGFFYVVEFNPEDGLFMYYKEGDAYGTGLWQDATRIDLTDNQENIDVTIQADTDQDDMADDWENSYFGDLSRDGDEDLDEDGLSDREEFQYGTNPKIIDSDGDKFTDQYEVNQGTDPADNADNPGAVPIIGVLHNVHEPDGSFKTYVDVYIEEGFAGNPGTEIDTIIVTKPSGAPLASKLDFVYSAEWRDWFAALDGSPTEFGTYTFTVVTTGGLTGTDTDDQLVNITIPNPDANTFSPYDGATVTSITPTFSWDPVDMDIPLYYRLEIRKPGVGRVYATGRIRDMLSHTVPEKDSEEETILEDGQLYEWRVRVTDSSDWKATQNRANVDWQSFTVGSPLDHPVTPGLELFYDGSGAQARTFVNDDGLPASALSHWVTVIDYDGVAGDGSSHKVTVTYPNSGPTKDLVFVRIRDAYSAYYELWDDELTQPIDSGAYDGNYTYRVTDPAGNWSEASDELSVLNIDPPDGISWAPFNNTTPTFTWNSVANATHYRVSIYDSNDNRIYNGFTSLPSYKIPPGILEPDAEYKIRIYAFNDHQWFEWDNVSNSSWDYLRFITGSSQAEDPFIDLASSGVHTWTYPDPFGTYTWFYVKIHDAQGVPDNIKSVNVAIPGSGSVVKLYLDYNETSTCGVYRGVYFDGTPPGIYTFTVTDRDGHTDEKEEDLNQAPINSAPYQDFSLVPANSALLGGTGVNFDWSDVSGAKFYQIHLYDEDFNSLFNIKVDANSPSEFTLPPGILKEKSLYRYRINARREFFEENEDNGSSAPSYGQFNANTFITTKTNGSNSPSINGGGFGVVVWHAPDPADGSSNYELEFPALVTDADGVPENIARVEVIYPDNTTVRTMKYRDFPDWGYNYFDFEVYNNPADIQTGVYIFRVSDFDGGVKTFQDTLPADLIGNTLPIPAGVFPPDGYVFNNTTPTISWSSVSGAQYYKVRIMTAWNTPTVQWSDELIDTQYTIPDGILSDNTTYGFRVYAFKEPINSDVDFYSCNTAWHAANFRFSIQTQDGDGDGIPDDWEENQGFDPGDDQDAGANNDGDALNNLDEYHLGTNPFDADTDNDGVNDDVDAFPLDATETQDTDSDGIGDNTDDDIDGDGISNADEINAGSDPLDQDSVPGDVDGDGIPDTVEDERDSDNDGFDDLTDNCENTPNPGQADVDGDDFGDVCDNCPDDPNADQADFDDDNVGDVCDNAPEEWNPGQEDADGDGVPDVLDNCPADHNPMVPYAAGDSSEECAIGNYVEAEGELWQPNYDCDDMGDACDDELSQKPKTNKNPPPPDTDEDGIIDSSDNCPDVPNDQIDTDDDGQGDACDTDDDGDGISDYQDRCPLVFDDGTDTDSDGLGDACDNCVDTHNFNQIDSDADGFGDACDNCTDIPNPGQLDSDFDDIGDSCDNCPNTANTDQADDDGDGIGNACEPPVSIKFEFQDLTDSDPYEAWIPADGRQAQITAILEDQDGNIITDANISLEVIYGLTSSLNGKYLNDESQDTSLDYDANCVDGSAEPCQDSIVITSLDFGGKTVIRAQALDNSNNLLAEGELRVPKDRDADGLPDAWELAHGFDPARADSDVDGRQDYLEDEDSSVNNADIGDGLTVFEEYRGVRWNDIHHRLNPDKKNLFICGVDFPAGLFGMGTAFANVGVDVFITEATSATLGQIEDANLSVLIVQSDDTSWSAGDKNSGHIRRAGIRLWDIPVLGESYFAYTDANNVFHYGQPTTIFTLPMYNYRDDHPYLDHSSEEYHHTGMLDPVDAVEDADDDGVKDKKEDKNRNGILDGDRVETDVSTWRVDGKLNPFNIDDDEFIELPQSTGDPTLVPAADEYELADVYEHVITHEVGHAVGMGAGDPTLVDNYGHCFDQTCVMYHYSINWKRADKFCPYHQGQIHVDNHQ